MIEHLRIDSHGIGKKTSGIQDHVPGLGSEAWHHSINDDLTDDGVSSAISSLAAAMGSRMREDDSVERKCYLYIPCGVPKAEGLYQKWVL